MPVNIKGKSYSTVAERINKVANTVDSYSLTTEVIDIGENHVVMKATLKIDDNLYTGHAYEDIGSSKINETSALENCETSAIGRSLSTAGWAGSEFASADELVTALNKQNTPSKAKKEDLSGSDWRDKPIGFKSGKNEGKSYREVDEETLVWIINDCKVDAWKTKAVAEMQLRENPDNDKKTESVTKQEADDLFA